MTTIARARSAAATKRWRDANKDRARQQRRARYGAEAEALRHRRATPHGWATHLIPKVRHRAKKAGLAFAITARDLICPTHCPVLGILLEYAGSTKAVANPNCASIDRFDNDQGYVPGNVRVISTRANMLKKDGSLAELQALVRWMERGGN